MPLPKPRPDEDKDDFIDRCMGDDVTNEDFPDPAQRRAVCESQWDKREGSSAMKYPHILEAVATPWAILPATLKQITDILVFRAEGGTLTAEEIQTRIGLADGVAAADARPRARVDGAIAVLPLHGPIMHRASLMTQVSGGTSTEQFTNHFIAAVNEPAISAIVLDVDSPGGSVSGVDELATEIRNARGTKPIIAVANTIMASAAFFIAAAADEIVATPSGFVGAIGTILPHFDISGKQEQEGIKTTLISAGKFKTEANEFEPLSDEARASLQEIVDGAHEMFVKSVARSRGVTVAAVRNGFGQGRLVSAQVGKELGMVDRINTMRETLQRLGAGTRPVAIVSGSPTDTPRSDGPTTTTVAPEDGSSTDFLIEPLEGQPVAADGIERRKRRLRLLEKSDPVR